MIIRRANEVGTNVLEKIRRTVALAAVAGLVMAGCGDDGEPTASNAPTVAGDETPGSEAGGSGGDEGDGETGQDQGAGASPGSGSIVLDGETISLDDVRCFLEPQPAAAGGGNILFVVQGEGENPQGEAVMIDISRYDDDSTFAGDLVDIYVGDYMAGDALELSAMTPAGSVELVGSTATAEGLTVEDVESGSSTSVSFSIDC